MLRLRRNLGHQRAIAVGLAYVEDRFKHDAVVVMDSDGEDDPSDVPRLLELLRAEGGRAIVFAERTRRSESWSFRFFYGLYKLLHRVLTGHGVRVGNFSAIPGGGSPAWSSSPSSGATTRPPPSAPGSRSARSPHERAERLRGPIVDELRLPWSCTASAQSPVYSDVVGVRLLVLALVLAWRGSEA